MNFSKLVSTLFETVDLAQNMVRDAKAFKLLNLMKNPDDNYSLDKMKELILYGYLNKVLLMFAHFGPKKLRNTTLYYNLLMQRKRFLKHLAAIIEVLDKNGVSYVIFKTFRPVIDVPSDIDILVKDHHDLSHAILSLREKFKVKILSKDTYSLGLWIADLDEYVDLYLKPHVADIVYLYQKPLLENRIYAYLNEFDVNIAIPMPKPEDEFCAVLGHAIIKENLVTLNDILSLLTYYKLSSWDALLSRLKAQKLDFAFKAFFKQQYHSLPQRLSVKDVVLSLYMLVYKMETLASIPFFLSKIGIRLRRFIEHSRRATYIRGFR